MNKFKLAVKHFKKICTHKKWVFKYCRLFGITWRGIKHDMSKFSPVEFLESIQYYTGTHSPIDECKKVNGYSKAWLHHKGRNDHHYEHWQDNFDKGGEPIRMPYEQSVEMLCDYLGAARAYLGDKFTYQGEFEWFCNKLNNNVAMHIANKVFIYNALYMLACVEKNLYKETTLMVWNTVPKRLQNTLDYVYANSLEYSEKDFLELREQCERGE